MRITLGPNVQQNSYFIEYCALFQDWRRSAAGLGIEEVTVHRVATDPLGKPLIIQLGLAYGGTERVVTLKEQGVELLTILVCEGRRYVAHVAANGATLHERIEELDAAAFGGILDLNALAFGCDTPMVFVQEAHNEAVFCYAQEVHVTLEKLAALQHANTEPATSCTLIEVSVLEVIPLLVGHDESAPEPDLKFTMALLLYAAYVGNVS